MFRLSRHISMKKLPWSASSFASCDSIGSCSKANIIELGSRTTGPRVFFVSRFSSYSGERCGPLVYNCRSFYPVCCLETKFKANPVVLTNGFSHSSHSLVRDDVDATSYKLNKLKRKLAAMRITLDVFVPGQYKILCPKCQGGSTEEKSFALLITEDGNTAVWTCHRGKCGWSGKTQVHADDGLTEEIPSHFSEPRAKRAITVESLELKDLCVELQGYFAERMINLKTLQRNRVMQKNVNSNILIAFTYWRGSDLISCKYRDVSKRFWQEKDTETIFYGLDDIQDADDLIIVEGEIDKLSMEEAGFRNCVSVPDGAPSSVSKKELPPEDKDKKYQYLWNCKEYLKKASRIILATDADGPGQALAEEIARRVGKEKCWRVRWPMKNETESFKDANEVLMYLGREALKDAVDCAELYPISGLFNFRNYFDEIDAFYHQNYEGNHVVSTGWKSIDSLYKVVPGELTIISGVPNSGKSEWIDALICNLNHQVGWKFALCSMENKVKDHARKLLEKHIKKPFFSVGYGNSVERMSCDELELGKQWLDNTFYLIRCEDDSLPSIKWVLSLAKTSVLRHGVRGLVIDPYNELDHQRPQHMTETEYVSQILTLIKRFAQHHSCHVWFVAHPRQLQNWNGEPPNLYDISGSAHFINKCDNGIIIHRNRNPESGALDQVQVCVRKVRNKVAGTVGDAFLSYNRVTGEYFEVDPNEQSSKLMSERKG